MGDDVPYILSTPQGDLVELPVSSATDDWPPYVHAIDLDYMFQILPPERAMEVFMAEFESARSVGGALWIGVWHPFVSGRLSRWLRIEKMIEYMLGTEEVWFARLEDIARHVPALRERNAYDMRSTGCPITTGRRSRTRRRRRWCAAQSEAAAGSVRRASRIAVTKRWISRLSAPPRWVTR